VFADALPASDWCHLRCAVDATRTAWKGV